MQHRIMLEASLLRFYAARIETMTLLNFFKMVRQTGMPTYKITTLISSLLLILAAVLPAQQVAAAVPYLQQDFRYQYAVETEEQLLYAQADKQQTNQQAESGTLVLPASLDNNNEQKEKQCMTVCGRWGEECMFINRGTGGTTKKCRRACKKFVEECF